MIKPTHVLKINGVIHNTFYDGEFYYALNKAGNKTRLKVSMADRNWFIVKYLVGKRRNEK